MKKSIRLIFFVLVIALLTITMVGCGREDESLEGKNIVTFELNGGTMDYKTSSSKTKVHFAYIPGTYVLDPVEDLHYDLYRSDYEFTGWYTSPDCNSWELWSFDDVINQEKLTLYAGWRKAIKHTYTVYYVDANGNPVSLGEYRVEGGDKFDDRQNIAGSRVDRDDKGQVIQKYTTLAYYSDAALTKLWDSEFKHPGGSVDTDVAVYVDYIPGEWNLVYTYDQFKSAVNSGKNVYLMNDVDCDGQELCFRDNTYSGVIEGNGYTVSNFTVTSSGSLRVSCAMFYSLGDGAEIRNISFDGVQYKVSGVNTNVDPSKVVFKLAALAIDAGNVTVTDVTVTGSLVATYENEYVTRNDAVYSVNEGCNVTVTGFTANITLSVVTE